MAPPFAFYNFTSTDVKARHIGLGPDSSLSLISTSNDGNKEKEKKQYLLNASSLAGTTLPAFHVWFNLLLTSSLLLFPF